MHVSKFSIILLCMISLCSFTTGYKILMACPAPARSHHNLCKGIVDILVERGHEVTFLNAFPRNNSGSREIGVDASIIKNAFNPFLMLNMSKIDMIKQINSFTPQLAEIFFASGEIQKLLNDESEHFDAYILEYFLNDFMLGLGVRYNCPTIILSPLNLMSWLALQIDTPLSIAIVPNLFTSYSTNMNIWQRTLNTLFYILEQVMGILYLDPVSEKLYQQYLPKESKRVPYSELKNTIVTTLVNTHPSIGVVRPLLPNTVEIGGYHIKGPEALPDDIKQILDSSKEGVIFFSMGSNLKSSDMSLSMRKTLLKGLASVKETVLWKFEVDLPEKPKNVIIRSWLPQTGILDHPNVKLFISHGGLLSCTEATHFGKPMLIIPVFGDQHHNAIEVTNRNQGIFLKFENVTDESFQWALNEALSNNKYMNTAKQLQTLFHDRPMKPRDLAGFYVEHAIRTKGAKHLSPPKLPRYSLLLLDVFAIMLTPCLIFLSVSIYCCRKLCCKKGKNQLDNKLKQN